jgi:penicillin-binding protein 1A
MRRLGRLLLGTLGIGLFLALAGLLAGGAFVWASLERLSRADLLGDVRLAEPLRIYSAEGRLMGEYGEERRIPLPYGSIPPILVHAFVAAEDRRFYEHAGIDLRGLARAALRYLRTGEPAEGGSTLTMQVVRNLLLTPEKTFERKLAEVLMALHLERVLTKDEILTLYLNKIFFGHRAYGVAAAAELYYGKSPQALSLAEAAMLAAIPKAPTTDNPVTNPLQARARRDYVLGRMAELGYIGEAAYREALAEPDRASLHRRPVDLDAGYAAEMARQEMVRRFGAEAYRGGYRVQTTIEGALQAAAQQAVREAILAYDRRHGYRGPERRGLRVGGADDEALAALLAEAEVLPELRAGIVTQADARRAEVYLGSGERATLALTQVQWARPFKGANRMGPAPRRVDAVVQPGDLVRLRRDAQGGWTLAQSPSVAAALVALAPGDGAIRALVGGYHFGVSQFNRAADARRQPGSAFKPFVYAAALDRGWTPASLVLDEPIALEVGPGDIWEPGNADGRTLGPIRLRLALAQSRNLAAIDLLDRVGIDFARGFAGRFGFAPADLPSRLTLALGNASVTLPQMAGGYAVFANGGFRVEPHLIARIETGDGRVLWQADPPRACAACWFAPEDAEGPSSAGAPQGAPQAAPGDATARRVLEPRVSYQMHSMLQDVIRSGTGRRARALKRSDLAGKTGTTNEARDAWFCGYQKGLAAVAWMGFDDFSPLGKGETGGESALGLWVRFMGEALKGSPEARLPVPAGMVQVHVDRGSGRLAAGDEDAVSEWVREEDLGRLEGPAPVFYSGRSFEVIHSVPGIIESVH